MKRVADKGLVCNFVSPIVNVYVVYESGTNPEGSLLR